MKSDVFQRYGSDAMTRNSFYFVMGLILTWGFGVSYAVSMATAAWHPTTLEFLLVGLVLPFAGIFMSASKSAFVSFLGFNLVAIPFGAILGPLLAAYKLAQPGVVGEAAMLTAVVTGAMAITGLMFPDFYKSIGGYLFASLFTLLVVIVLSFFIPALMELSIISYLAAGLFALYIGYDMYRASEIPATMDNAVDVSVSLYLDIINLFLWILRILGSSKK